MPLEEKTIWSEEVGSEILHVSFELGCAAAKYVWGWWAEELALENGPVSLKLNGKK
jgi:hypothetical protein